MNQFSVSKFQCLKQHFGDNIQQVKLSFYCSNWRAGVHGDAAVCRDEQDEEDK